MQFKNKKLILTFLIFTFNSLATINIDQLLEQTEFIGTSKPQEFDTQLILLEKHQEQFNQAQKDFYDYLTYYKQGYNGHFDQSLNNFNALFERSKLIGIKFRSKVKIANIHIISGDILNALKSLDYVLNNIDELKDERLKVLGFRIAQTVYNLIEENELSEQFSNLILDHNPPDSDKCTALVNIGDIKLRGGLDNGNVSVAFINESIEFCESIGDYVFSNLLRLDWLKYNLNLSTASSIDYVYVLTELNEKEQEIENTHYKNLINIKNSLFAQTYWKMKDINNAVKYANLTIIGSQSIGSTVQKLSALELLIEYSRGIGDSNKAFEYLEEKNKAKEIYFDQQQAKLMAYQKVKHDSLAKMQQIKLLNHQNELLQLKNELAEKSKKNQFLINILFLITVTFFILFAYRLIKQQKKFKKLSELDQMTLIYNRKGIKDYMAYMLPYSEKKKEIIGYVIFDLDLFKRVNDVYGHVVGDWVIKQSIQVCKDLNNDKIKLARLGGEEFSIVIRDSNIDETIEFSEQCRKAINQINTLEGTKHDFEVSASFGLTTSEISGYDYTSLMTNADNALYYSKENGRNRLTVYHPYTTKQ